jgi:SSS family transporter
MNYLDYIIVIVFFLSMIGMGMYFKKSKIAADYFLGGKDFGWFSLCLSAMATQLSVVSFVSAPAFVGLRKGGGMQWLTYEFGVPLAMLVIITLIGPALFKSGVVSVYAFVERRFNQTTSLLLSGVFLLSRSFATSIIIYTVCLILAYITGIPFWITMLILAVITILYSLEGGMKAVVYSEVVQMIIKFLGILLIAYLGLEMIGGWDVFLKHLDRERIQVIDFSKTGFHGDEFGFWPMLLGGIFLYTSYYGTDQTQAQRILSSKDQLTVKKLLLFNGLFRFPITLTYCIGGLILGTLVTVNADFAAKIPAERPDLMIPVFIANYVPHGVVGILVVSLIAAGMSAYSSTLNSLSAATMEDFVSKKWKLEPTKYIYYSKMVALLWGLLTMILAFYVGGIAKTVIEAINKISSMFYGPVLAVFVLAILTKRVKASSVNIALITGVFINLMLWIFFKQVFWFWWNFIGFFTTTIVALGLTLFNPLPEATVRTESQLFYPSPKVTWILVGFFIFILLFSYFLPSFFQ